MIAVGLGGDHLLLVAVGVIVVARIGFRVVRPRRRRAPESRESDRRPARSTVSAGVSDRANQTPLEPATAADSDHLSESSEEFATPGVSALEIKDLRVSYGPKQAVAGVSLVINEGEIFGLLGPNGAGKTTTLSAVEGLLRPDAGTILVGGIDSRRDPLGARSRLGVQLQSTGFPAALTIREIVRLYAGLYGLPLSMSEQRDLLAGVGLDDEATKRFAQLSGGQQQRLSLLIATIHDPPLVLLDEPTAGLDPQARRQLWSRIERLRRSGRSILLTTHSMEEAQAVCDRVAIMDHGKVLAVGTPAGLIERHKDEPRVRSVAHGEVTLDDVFIGLTGEDLRD